MLEQNGEYLISAERQVVWDALNDPDILRQCVAGCLSMEKVSATEFQSKVKAKIGPVSATFDANLVLSDIKPPDGYTLTANVKGGPAGFGKGAAKVDLANGGSPGSTLLTYAVDASVGGKLAQIGSRLIDGAARKMADDFFSQFGEVVGAGPSPVVAASAAAVHPSEANSAVAADAAAQVRAEATAAQSGPPREAGPNWIIWLVVFAALAFALTAAL